MITDKRASILVEALPYIQKFRGRIIVIKYGGAAMENDELVAGVLRDIVFLEAVGLNPVVVHGGGKAISRAMKEAGLTPTFIDGLRVSDAASMDIIVRTLADEINPGIVRQLEGLGGRAQGFPGYKVLKASKTRYVQEKTGQEFDLGFVGDIKGVMTAPLLKAIKNEITPVISPLGSGEDGKTYNINADIAAAEVAEALQAYKIIYLSDVNGILHDPRQPDSTIPSLTATDIAVLKKKGVIDGGMLPKVDSALKALRNGVQKAHFLDGRIPHSLLLEIFTDSGIGTEITLE